MPGLLPKNKSETSPVRRRWPLGSLTPPKANVERESIVRAYIHTSVQDNLVVHDMWRLEKLSECPMRQLDSFNRERAASATIEQLSVDRDNKTSVGVLRL